MADAPLIAPSLLSADLLDLQGELETIRRAPWVHIDVMDGHFVPEITFGTNMVKAVARATDAVRDVHLMVNDPDAMVEGFLEAGAQVVSFHAEAARHAHRIVDTIHKAGAKASLALNPGTPLTFIEPLLGDLDMVLIMSVDPGYGGQSFIEESLGRIRQVRSMAEDSGVHPLIQVDGGVCPANAQAIVEAGADVLVAGSAVFKAADRDRAIAELQGVAR